MGPKEHADYAADLLLSLRDGGPESEALSFSVNPKQSRNVVRTMTAILCHRLFENSTHRPFRKTRTTYEWNQGTFNYRSIADWDYFWTNMRPGVADEMHEIAKSRPAAYLLAFCERANTTMSIWAVPEPLLHDGLTSLLFEEAGKKYTVQIRTDKQRFERYPDSPDLTPYYRRLQFAKNEMLLLNESREADALVKRERAATRGEEDLAAAGQNLVETGAFDPSGIDDARERVLSSIVRRRGQPAFRQGLLAAYKNRCAFSDCEVEAVLDAAHVVSYRGPDTNHPANGLLLRTDLHTLFDLKLIAVDVETMTLLVSPKLSGTCYAEYRGRLIRVPENRDSQPSREALNQHRKESRL
jgi:hypothetical protein